MIDLKEWKEIRKILPYDDDLKKLKDFDEITIANLKIFGILKPTAKEEALNCIDKLIKKCRDRELINVSLIEEYKSIKQKVLEIKEQ